MTKSEFIESVPDIIDHKTEGYSKLEIIANSATHKGICYRHKDNTSSGGTHGKNWFEVYQKLADYLKKEGHIHNSN